MGYFATRYGVVLHFTRGSSSLGPTPGLDSLCYICPLGCVPEAEKLSSQDSGIALSSVPTTREVRAWTFAELGTDTLGGESADQSKALLDGVLSVPAPGLDTCPVL